MRKGTEVLRQCPKGRSATMRPSFESKGVPMSNPVLDPLTAFDLHLQRVIDKPSKIA